MKVSVIIPAFNSANYILESVNSALSQTYTDIEVLVIDDGSTDRTRTILDDLIASGRVQYFYQNNQGPGVARNLGLRKASGELVAFLDADDVWRPEKLEKQVKLLTGQKVGLVYSDIEFFGASFRYKRISDYVRFFRGQVLDRLLDDNFVPTSSVLARKDMLVKVGGFDEEVKIGEDYALWLKMALIASFDYIPETLVRYRIHAAQSSRSAFLTYKSLRQLYVKMLADERFFGYDKKIAKKRRRATLKMLLSVVWPRHGVEV